MFVCFGLTSCIFSTVPVTVSKKKHQGTANRCSHRSDAIFCVGLCPGLNMVFLIAAPVDSRKSYKSEEHEYTNTQIDTESLKAEDTNQPYVNHVQKDAVHHQQVMNSFL